jgi:hypothetical protein
MAQTKREVGILVRCRPGTYYRDPANGAVHTGPSGRGSRRRGGSGPFRVTTSRLERDERQAPECRLFERVSESNTDE